MSNSPIDWQGYVLKDYGFTEFAPKKLVLDIGCGDGTQLQDLSRRECRALGIEPDWASLVDCRKQGLTVLQALAEHLPVKSASLDGVVGKGVIPYTEEPRAFGEIGRVLRAGGIGHFCYLGAGYYLRYLLAGRSWKFRFYGLRSLVNTWLCAVTGKRLPGFLGDTVYQSRRRIATHYRNNRFRLLQNSPSPTFLGFPVFIYHSVEKVAG